MTLESTISENCRRLRLARGFTQARLADACGLSRNAYADIERGRTEKPRVKNLEAIAHALDVSLNELLSPPARLETVRFRSKTDLTRRQEATRQRVLQETARWLSDFSELEALLHQEKSYPLVKVTEDLKSRRGRNRVVWAASRVREVLNLTPNEPIRDLAGLLESAGVKVRQMPIGWDRLFGLSVGPDDKGPAIVINTSDRITVERRIFTAAHELGHLLLHPRAYDVNRFEENQKEENQADRFASHFLMPQEAFRRKWLDASGLSFVDRVLHVKRLFRVSYSTVLRRICEEKMVRFDLNQAYPIFRSSYQKQYGQRFSQKEEPLPLAALDFVEDRLSRLVRKALEANLISASRAAEILHVSLEDLRRRIATWEVAA